MVESVSDKPSEATTAASDAGASQEPASTRPVYTGDKGDIEYNFERDMKVEPKVNPTYTYGRRVRIAALWEHYEQYLDHLVEVGGWARTTRMGGKDFCFVELTDGSCSRTLQVVVDSSMDNFADVAKSLVGSSYKFKGKLIRSPKDGQPFELQVCDPQGHSCKVLGHCDGKSYQLAKKRHSNEVLRDMAHLRPRTKLISAVARVRNNLAYATHRFFQDRGFLYIHTPIVTASDCEGAGEMFQVTTVLPEHTEPLSMVPTYERVGQEEEEREKRERIAKGEPAEEKKISKNLAKKLAKKAAKKGGQAPEATPADGDKPAAEGEAAAAEEKPAEEAKKEAELIPMQDRKVNYGQDFFGKPAFLTVSGQINVETYNCALGDVYTFGPTFRAEKSNTTRHLAEFWMIEPEIAFADLDDVMDLTEDYVKYCLRYVLQNNKDDVEFFNQWVDKGLLARLENVVNSKVVRITYTEAIQILLDDVAAKKVKFENKVFWGVDMFSEHERYLAETVYKGPVIVYDYPKDFKAFYMRQNDDGKTVQAMDMLVPGIGELVGGSAREERLDKLDAMIEEKKLEKAAYWWYRELRQYGSQPHGGFGLGFERLVMMATGVENIKDVIPFPRFWGKADF